MKSGLERLWTYQQLADRYTASVSSIKRWFGPFRRKHFNPTRRTVRIPESIVQKFESSRNKNHARKKD